MMFVFAGRWRRPLRRVTNPPCPEIHRSFGQTFLMRLPCPPRAPFPDRAIVLFSARPPVDSPQPFTTLKRIYPSWLVPALWLTVILWAATIFYLSSLSGNDLAKFGINIWDKAAHFIAFFSGSVVLTCALRLSTGWKWFRIGLVCALIISAYAATDEYHQLYTPHRSGGDVGDWLADALGGTLGTAFTILTYALYKRSNRPAATGN